MARHSVAHTSHSVLKNHLNLQIFDEIDNKKSLSKLKNLNHWHMTSRNADKVGSADVRDWQTAVALWLPPTSPGCR